MYMLNFTTTATSLRYWSDIISPFKGREAWQLFVLGHLRWLDRRFSWSQMGLSENVVYPEKPNGFADHYPVFKWLFHWGYTPFSDIPRWTKCFFSDEYQNIQNSQHQTEPFWPGRQQDVDVRINKRPGFTRRESRRFVEGQFLPIQMDDDRWTTAGLFFVGSCTLYPFRCIDDDRWWHIYIYIHE